VWVNFGANVVESRMDISFPAYSMLFEFGIMFGWQTQRSDSGGCGMRMHSLVFFRYTRCAASSVIRKRVSSFLYGPQKTACGACGRMHSGWYDRNTRRVRDLSSADTRI
jgi:hypothetical protein